MTWQVILLSLCGECGKGFVDEVKSGLHHYREENKVQTKDRLVQHHKSHLLNPAREHGYSCDLCKYTTSCKAYLVNHSLVC